MTKALEIRDDQEIDEVLQRNVPHLPDVIVKVIGDTGRQLRRSLNRKSDFPIPVTVETRDGRKIDTTLENLYADASQWDGTFYFTDPVRVSGTIKNTVLFGSEIKTVTIREPKE